MKDEIKTVLVASVISFVGFVFSKIFSFFSGKIKEIDSIEGLKKEFQDFKTEHKEDYLELKQKINDIHSKIYK